MLIDINSLPPLLTQTEQQQLPPLAPDCIPSCPLPSPPLSDKDPVDTLEPSSSDLLPSTTTTFPSDRSYQFPVKVLALPNKGRSYVATRRIQAGELVFVAEPLGTTLCDPWLDCGICYYCWRSIPNSSTSIRLPDRKRSSKSRIETIMVFCDPTCLQRFQYPIAQRICQVEQMARRTWNYTSATKQSLGNGRQKSKRSPLVESGSGSMTALVQIQQALQSIGSKKTLSTLDDPSLDQLLNVVWTALDTQLLEEETLFRTIHCSTMDSTSPETETATTKSRRLEKAQALYPFLTTQLLGGSQDHGNDSPVYELAAKTSDDDCEMIRLITEILLRRSTEDKVQDTVILPPGQEGTDPSRTELQPTFEDYCAMQSNELVLFRKELAQQEEDSMGDESMLQSMADRIHLSSEKGDFFSVWRQVRSFLPDTLLSCLYVYLRIRDAYFLLSLENEKDSSLLGIDHFLFRTILFREVANSFGIRDEEDELLGFAVFPRACFFNHSCRPNIEKRLTRSGSRMSPPQKENVETDSSTLGRRSEPRQIEYWSRQVIEEGEECCISYGDMTPGRLERQTRLEEEYFFRCCCPRCIEEEFVEKNEST